MDRYPNSEGYRGVYGCMLLGKHNLRLVGGVFDRACVGPLCVAFHDSIGRYWPASCGWSSVNRRAILIP